MPTGLKVVLSTRAEKDFDDILNYIKKDFGSQAAINFKKLILNFLDLIQAFPEIGSLEVPEHNIRGFVVHKRLKIMYHFNNKRIILLRLFDTRQHPQNK